MPGSWKLRCVLLRFPWWDVKSGTGCGLVLGEQVHPHLDSSLHTVRWIIKVCFQQQEVDVATFYHHTCSIPGLSGWSSGLVSTCSGTSLQPALGIPSQCLSTVRARCSSVCFFKPGKHRHLFTLCTGTTASYAPRVFSGILWDRVKESSTCLWIRREKTRCSQINICNNSLSSVKLEWRKLNINTGQTFHFKCYLVLVHQLKSQ